MLFLMPAILLALVSFELAGGVMRDLPIAVVDTDGSAISRELTRRLDSAPGLKVAATPDDMIAAEKLVRARKVYAIIALSPQMARDALRGDTGAVTILYNASYSTPSGGVVRAVEEVVQSYAATLAVESTAAVAGPGTIRPPPVAARTSVLFNPQGSYELQLVGLLWPAILHLVFMVAIVSALGRELRDGTIGPWLSASPRSDAVAQVTGKVAPYLLVFTAWGIIANAYLSWFRGWPIEGSATMIFFGYITMYLAYVGMAALVVGLTRSMAQSLSVAGIFAGASFAFSGAIFPIESASAFARWWSLALPYTAFVKLWAEQYVMGTDVAYSMRQMWLMLGFFAMGSLIGIPRYIAAARQPSTWGKR